MNKDAIRELTDFMKKCRYEFDMYTSANRIDMKNRCGTAGCIAGHAALLWPKMRNNVLIQDSYITLFTCRYGKLEKLFDMPKDKFYRLIAPIRSKDGVSCMYDYISKDWAIRTLEHLLNTGEVNWQATKSPV